MAAGAAVSVIVEVERAVLDALRMDAGVQAVLGVKPRIFDGDAEKPAYPFLELARHTVEDISAASAAMWRHEIDLAVMTSVGGRAEAKAAADAVRAVIDASELAIDGYRCVVARTPFLDVMRASTHFWRALVRVRMIVEEAP